MEVLDASSLADRLKWESKEYWLHLQAASPWEKYPAKQHARKVQEKLGLEEGLIYLPGQPARNNEDSDMPAPFRQRRYFYYLSGCDEPNCFLTYDIGRDVLCLFIPRINPERVIWNGRGSNKAEALDNYDIDTVRWADELPNYLHQWMGLKRNRNASIFALNGGSRPPISSEAESFVDYTSLKPAINICRMIKDDHEIGLIRQANKISSQAHVEILANILKFKNEAQVEGLFMDVCISQQAKQQAYDPIVASGPNAGTLHYDANNEDFQDRQLMCLDAGCEYKLYASDITRTFPLSATWPSQEAESVYRLVQNMQETCIKQLAPGVRYLDLHIQAHQIAISGLLQLGILHNGTKEEIYKAGTSRAFFPHGLGHHIGLEVHDIGQTELMSASKGRALHQQVPSLYPEGYHNPVYDSTTCHAPTDPESSHLEEGMVVTVEPGIYFSVYALEHFYFSSPQHSRYINKEVVQRYLPVGGVRIEDDILVTSRGHENLTTAPKGEKMLEIIRNGKAAPKVRSPVDPIVTHRMRPENEASRVRAPGISANTPEPILRPLARAATLPTKFRQQDSADFEPSNEPSLFANFKRSMTIDHKIQRWHLEPHPIPSPSVVTPLCGKTIPDVKHMYMCSDEGHARSTATEPTPADAPRCRNCMILAQSLERLRHNLASSRQGSPLPSPGFPDSSLNSQQTISVRGYPPHVRQAQIDRTRLSRNPANNNPAIRSESSAVRKKISSSPHPGCSPCHYCFKHGFPCEMTDGSKTCGRCRHLQLACKISDHSSLVAPSDPPCEECVLDDCSCKIYGPDSRRDPCIAQGTKCLCPEKHTAAPAHGRPRPSSNVPQLPTDAFNNLTLEHGPQNSTQTDPLPPLYASFPTFSSNDDIIKIPQYQRPHASPSPRDGIDLFADAPPLTPLVPNTTQNTPKTSSSHSHPSPPHTSIQNSRHQAPLPAGWEFARGRGRSVLEQARAKALEQRQIVQQQQQQQRQRGLTARPSMPVLPSARMKGWATDDHAMRTQGGRSAEAEHVLGDKGRRGGEERYVRSGYSVPYAVLEADGCGVEGVW